MDDKLKRIYVPMTESGFYILFCLRQPQHGYGISQKVREMTGGALVISAGTMYGTLSKMEKDGLIAFYKEEEKRKLYRITALGEEILQLELKRIERKLDARLSQLQDVRHAPLGEITLIHSPALRLFWIDTALTAPDYSALELSTSRLAAAQAEALVFLGKVGFSVSQEHLNEGRFGQYDGEFLVLDEADRYAGDVIDLPASLCARVRFRGHHAESPAQYRRLMQFIREGGYTAAGFSREITVIDYGFTTDTEKFVTEIMIPLQKV